MDYLKSEAKRLPGGTAAKVLSALTLAAIDSDIRNSGSERQSSVTKLDPDTSFVTITISRKTAEEYIAARFDDDSLYCAQGEVHDAIQAALGGER
jgi:hypothetical protein